MDGQVYAMSGASLRHNIIVANLVSELVSQLRDRPCRALPSDMKVRLPDWRKFFYPDVSVFSGEPQFHDEHTGVLLNPIVLIEVLSESTASFDREKKFLAYQHIESLQEYILISQDAHLAEQYVRKTKGSWTYTATVGLESFVTLPSIACTLSLKAVYDKTE